LKTTNPRKVVEAVVLAGDGGNVGDGGDGDERVGDPGSGLPP